MLKEEMARCLLSGIYYPISAVAAIGKDKSVLSVALFDTEFGCLPAVTADPEEIWLFTNHPEGRRTLYEKDQVHISRIRALYPGIPLRVLITNEDFVCFEYALFLPGEV